MTDVAAPTGGTFCVSELNTPDIEGSKRFYGELFGWSAVDMPGTGGRYALFQLGGKDVAAMRRVENGPHRWVPHVFVDSIDDTLARARRLGADAAGAPLETPGVTRTFVFRDPEGAELGLWESGGHPGARLTEVTGSMWWVEVLARDITAARAFYTELFGWTFFESSKIGFPYTVFKMGEQLAAGGGQYEPEWGITSRWHVLFAVENFEAAVKRTAAHGGTLAFWRDVPYNGRFGILNDPGSAVFCIMDPNQVTTPS
jgi:predicted enzyme related to lactoylglutathione lyase